MATTVAKCIATSYVRVRLKRDSFSAQCVRFHEANANGAESLEHLMANVDCKIDSSLAFCGDSAPPRKARDTHQAAYKASGKKCENNPLGDPIELSLELGSDLSFWWRSDGIRTHVTAMKGL